MSKSTIFLLISLCFIGGVASASFFNVRFGYWIIPAIFFLGLSFIWRPKFSLALAICFLSFFLGLWRYSLAQIDPGPKNIQFYTNQEIEFEGMVSRYPDIRKDKVLLTLDEIKIDNKPVKGKVLIFAPLYPLYHYGDVLKVKGKIQIPRNFSGFNYRRYLSRFGIYAICFYPKIHLISRGKGSTVLRAVFFLRDKSREKILSALSEPQASFLSALLLGLKKEFPDELKYQFSRTGTAHLTAISGMHISIIICVLAAMLTKVFSVSRRKIIWFIIPVVGIFVILVGAPASAIRAALMGFVFIFGQYLGRPHQSFNALIFAAALMLLANPLLLSADIGFQLSFLAIAGIIFFERKFFRFLSFIPNFRFFSLRDLLSVTLSAQIFTLPLVLLYFNVFPWIAPLANILVVPVLPLIMIFGFIFLAFSFVPLLNSIFAWLVWVPLTYVLLIVKALANLPYFEIKISPFALIPIYSGLILLAYLWKRKESIKLLD